MSQSSLDFSINVERFSGFADIYDRYRPTPPALLPEVLTRMAKTPYPELVIDLGCGTGLFTRIWAGKARAAIGVDPTADMLKEAIAQTHNENITYRTGFSHQTGLPDSSASIVTCCQSLHWMEPQSTFEEIRRVLVEGGVFAACDYDWPPVTGSWACEKAYRECQHRIAEADRRHGEPPNLQQWEKSKHLARMEASGCFRFTREFLLHHVEKGNAERLVGLMLSQGGTMGQRKQGTSEAELGIDALHEIASRELGDEPADWVWSSRIRIGIK